MSAITSPMLSPLLSPVAPRLLVVFGRKCEGFPICGTIDGFSDQGLDSESNSVNMTRNNSIFSWSAVADVAVAGNDGAPLLTPDEAAPFFNEDSSP